jgi:hypothetical protein
MCSLPSESSETRVRRQRWWLWPRRRNTAVCFRTQSMEGEISYFVEEATGQPPTSTAVLGEDDMALIRSAAVGSLGEFFTPPAAWRHELAAALAEHPKGQYHMVREGEGTLEDVAVWVVDLPPEAACARPDVVNGKAHFQWVSDAHRRDSTPTLHSDTFWNAMLGASPLSPPPPSIPPSLCWRSRYRHCRRSSALGSHLPLRPRALQFRRRRRHASTHTG